MSDEREPPTPELNIDEKFAERMHYQTRIATLERDLAAAQAERDALKEMLPNTTGPERPPYTSWWEWAITYRRQLKKAEAEAAALRADAERYRWLRMNRLWLKANLPMIAAPELDTAIDQARGDGNG